MTNKYTTKKYLVGSQIEKYKNILRELQEEQTTKSQPQEHSEDRPIIEYSKYDLE
jgi:hypothetical protein